MTAERFTILAKVNTQATYGVTFLVFFCGAIVRFVYRTRNG